MRVSSKIAILVLLASFAGCSNARLFSGYQRENFDLTRVTESKNKTIQIVNDSPTAIQHIQGISFYSNSNEAGHFQVIETKVGATVVGQQDIFVPPMSDLKIKVTYAPLDLDTTPAGFAGWVTRPTDRWEAVDLNSFDVPASGEETKSKNAVNVMTKLAGKEAYYYKPAIHRAMLLVIYDKPSEGYLSIELVGGAVPGPNSEVTAVPLGGSGGENCVAGGKTACFTGSMSIDLPGLMKGGAVEVPMQGSIPFEIDGSSMKLVMDQFPPVLMALEGNGPGEPLEGKPIDAISIIISGVTGTEAFGSFDGQSIQLSEAIFRVRVLLGKVDYADIGPGLAAAVDFNIDPLEITTDEPFDGSKIVFGMETTLSDSPSGNGLFDAFLGSARVVVKFKGMLELP